MTNERGVPDSNGQDGEREPSESSFFFVTPALDGGELPEELRRLMSDDHRRAYDEWRSSGRGEVAAGLPPESAGGPNLEPARAELDRWERQRLEAELPARRARAAARRRVRFVGATQYHQLPFVALDDDGSGYEVTERVEFGRANGLIDVAPTDCFSLATGAWGGDIVVQFEQLTRAPVDCAAGWEDIAEVSVPFTKPWLTPWPFDGVEPCGAGLDSADSGGAGLDSAELSSAEPCSDEPVGADDVVIEFLLIPGSYRVRCSARGRDAEPDGVVEAGQEEYLVQLWPADPEPDRILAVTSSYGREQIESAAEGV